MYVYVFIHIYTHAHTWIHTFGIICLPCKLGILLPFIHCRSECKQDLTLSFRWPKYNLIGEIEENSYISCYQCLVKSTIWSATMLLDYLWICY